jgi:fructokinase
MKIDVLAIGELLADLVSEEYCENLQQVRAFRVYQGGSPSNLAANLQWLGARVALVACVGEDGIGRFLVEQLQAIGLDTAQVQRREGHPTSLVLVTKSRGTPDFLAYRGADVQLAAPDAALLASASIVHTTAFALSRSPAREVILDSCARAHAAGALVSVDWNFAPGIWRADDGRKVFDALLQLEPLLKLSADDAERFLGYGVSVDETKAFLDSYRAKAMCLTLGGEGVWYKEGGDPWQFEAALPVKEVVDTTGAGDAFWAGFLFARLQKAPLQQCVQQALSVATQKIQRPGPLYAKP